MFSVLLVIFLISVTIVLADEIRDAVKNGDIEQVKALVGKNPTMVNTKYDRNCTPLQFAAEVGYKEIAEFLPAKGAAIDIKGMRKDNCISCSNVDMF